MSIEREGFLLPPNPEKDTQTPQAKLELLLQTLRDLEGPDHKDLDANLVQQAKKNTHDRILELKKLYPELHQLNN